MDREQINKRLFGSSLEGNNRIPLTQKATQTFSKNIKKACIVLKEFVYLYTIEKNRLYGFI